MTAVIIQARMKSSRLPEKVLKRVSGVPILTHLINRLKKINQCEKIIVATTLDPSDDAIEQYCIENSVSVFRGSINNVMNRYLECARIYEVNIIIRACADTPIVDVPTIDKMVARLVANECDYCGIAKGYPCASTGVEVFTFNALEKQAGFELSQSDKEHVSIFMRQSNEFKRCGIIPDKEIRRSDLRLTVDTQADFDLITEIFKNFEHIDFSLRDVIKLLDEKPELKKINAHITQKKLTTPSIIVGIIVKTMDDEFREELKKTFIEKNHIGIELMYVSMSDPNFDWVKFSRDASEFDYVLYDKSLEYLTFRVPSHKVDLNLATPEVMVKMVKEELGVE